MHVMREEELLALVLSAPDDDAPRAVLADHWLEQGDPRGRFVALQLQPSAKNDKAARALLKEHEAEWLGDLALVTKKRVFRRGFLSELSLHKNAVATPAAWAAAARAPALATVERIDSTSGNAANYLRFVTSPAARSLRSIDVFSKPMLAELLAHDLPLATARELSLLVVVDEKTAVSVVRSPLFPALERVSFAVRYGGVEKAIAAAARVVGVRHVGVRIVPIEWGGDGGEFVPFLAEIHGRLASAPYAALAFDELFQIAVRRVGRGVEVELLCRHLRYAAEVIPPLRALCAIRRVDLRLPAWFPEVLEEQEPRLFEVFAGLEITTDPAWTGYLRNRSPAGA